MTRCVTRRDAIALFGGLTAFTLAGCNSASCMCAMTLFTPTIRDIGGRPPQALWGLAQL